jgi:DUF1365 family protein
VKSFLLGQGHVFHGRQKIQKNSFRYPNFFIYFPVSQVQELKQALKKHFRFFLSFEERNYLDGQSQNLDQSVRQFLIEQCGYSPETIWLQTMPRIFSYVFNPVSFWWCYRGSVLEGVLAEVNNTFGERHFYWVYQDGKDISGTWIRRSKEFHVSPFFQVDGYYDFKFAPPSEENLFLSVKLNYFSPDGRLSLATMQEGKLSGFEQVTRWQLLKKYSWMTIFVVYRIHYQALKLWLKKVPFYTKPKPPIHKVSL